MERYDTLIIGGGPAGLFAAANIRRDKKVVVLEKSKRPGKKLLMAGAGKCNITHTGAIQDFFSKYGDNVRFLRTALQAFSNRDLITFFKNRAVPTMIDKNGKVFPKSEKASDILETLVSECQNRGVRIHNDEAVLSIQKTEDEFTVKTEKSEYIARQVIISTGGKSYPSTGSTGDGYEFAKKFKHTIVQPRPSLTPISVKGYKFAGISGISLEDRNLYLYRNGKKLKEHTGDIGFTHKGLSGPGILDFSRYFKSGDTVMINLIDVPPDTFRDELIAANEASGTTSVKNFLKKHDLPESLVKAVLDGMNLDNKTTLSCLPKKMRNQLVDQFCNHPFEIGRIGDFNVAMATAGGISLKEVSPKTMESRLVKNLYFAGELMDIDGNTGGYNIQAALSTGSLAAQSINLIDN